MSSNNSPSERQLKALLARLKFKHLALAAEIEKHSSIRKAAQILSLTQPAATKLLQDLEDASGTRIFERGRYGARPTTEGQIFLRHTKLLLSDLYQLTSELGNASIGISGNLRLGVVPSLAPELLSRCIDEMISKNANITITLHEAVTTELLTFLRKNELDIIFGRVIDLKQSKDMSITNIYSESFLVVASPDHWAAKRQSMSWQQLSECRWTLPQKGTPFREMADELFTKNRAMRPFVAVESSSFEKIRYLVSGSDLLGILPRTLALKSQKNKELAVILPNLSVKPAPISLIAIKNRPLTPLIERFINVTSKAAKDLKLAI